MRRCSVRNLIDRILAIKQRRRLLQRQVLGLHDKEPQKDELAREPAHIHELRQTSRSVETIRANGRNVHSISIPERSARSGSRIG